MEVSKEISGTYESQIKITENVGIKVHTRHHCGIAYFTIDTVSSDHYIAQSRGVDMPHDRAQHYHELLVSKVQAFIGEIEAVMKEIGL